MPLSHKQPNFSRIVREEIVLIRGYAVCHSVDDRGTRTIANLLEQPEDILDIPRDKSIMKGWKGRHIGWLAHSDAVVVRDDRFANDPMPVF